MKWIYSIKHRLKAAFMLAIILALISAKNLWDKYTISELGKSFSSVFEDRLLVESYIYSLSEHLYQKKIGIENYSDQDLVSTKLAQNTTIMNLLVDYEKTKFTNDERIHFDNLKANINEMIKLESQETILSEPVKKEMDIQFNEAINNLHQLSAIQVLEGKSLNDVSRKIISSSAMLTKIELVVLIVIGLLIQALVFTSKSIIPKNPQHHNLN